jgi:hypothetical protein
MMAFNLVVLYVPTHLVLRRVFKEPSSGTSI